jgi:mRNA-degrading endonuclease RelE of RelBE toxin-antitoxin system
MNTEEKSMNQRVLDYQITGAGFDSLVQDLCLTIYSYPKKKLRLTDDDCADFFLFFLTKFRTLLKTYKDQGKPFEYYFNSLLRWKLKTFMQIKRYHRLSGKAMFDQHIWEKETGRESFKFILSRITRNPHIEGVFHVGENGTIKKESEKKQMLFMLLKNAKDISPEDADHIAHLTGFSSRWIYHAVHELHESLASNLHRYTLLQERRNNTFFRIRSLEERLRYEVNQETKDRLKQRIAVLRHRMHNTITTLSRIRLSPTHKDIARVCGFSKGTIDTSLTNLKIKLKRLYHQKQIKYA